MSELLTPDERGHLSAAYKASRLESQDVGLYTAEVLKGVPALLRDVERLHAIAGVERDPLNLDDHGLIMAMGVHDDDCECPYCAEWKRRKLVKFATWIISLDDPDGPGFEARKAVTMAQIIGKAREALAQPEEV